MITPAFNIIQDDKFLIVTIKAPYTKVSETEVEFFEKEFRFYSKPYFLRLLLPADVVENGEESANYDAEKGTFTIKVPKAVEGEFFEGLDFQTKLLSTRRPTFKSPVIEIVGENKLEENDVEDFCWDIIQNEYAEEEGVLVENSHYGFANQKTGVFTKLRDEIPDLVDVKDPDRKPVLQRRKEKTELEQKQFSDDHYLADLYQDSDVKMLLDYTPYFVDLYKQKGQNTVEDISVDFTDAEQERMRMLPNKEYLLDHNMKQQVLLSIVDILLAYCYSNRTTEGESTVESAWTITKLSSTLSWLDSFSSMDSLVLSFIRRSLCYPLHRNWELSKRIIQDTSTLLSLGSKIVLKCFLDIHGIFNNSDPYYLLNELYITDMCVWIQSLKNSIFIKMGEALSRVSIEKCDVGLELVELEEAARLALEEANNIDEMVDMEEKMGQLKMQNSDVDSSESDESSDGSTECSSTSQSDTELDSDDTESSDSEDDCLIFGKDELSHERRR